MAHPLNPLTSSFSRCRGAGEKIIEERKNPPKNYKSLHVDEGDVRTVGRLKKNGTDDTKTGREAEQQTRYNMSAFVALGDFRNLEGI